MNLVRYSAGDRVMVRDVYGQWHPAKVVGTFTTDNSVKVEPDRWGALGGVERYPTVSPLDLHPA